MKFPRFVYVLDVVYPPEGPGEWPVARSYFSKSWAKERARFLESHGAKVTIIRSEPIVWKVP